MQNELIYNFFDKRSLKIQDLQDIKFAQEAAGRTIFLYSRYMSSKYKYYCHDTYNLPLCPGYAFYIIFFDATFLRAKQIFNTNIVKNSNFKFMEWPRSGCKELDIISAKLISKELGIKVKYKKFLNLKKFNKDRTFKIHVVSLIDFIRDIFFIFRPIKNLNLKKEINEITLKNKKATKVLNITGDLDERKQEIYGYLSILLEEYLSSKNLYLLNINPYNLGIKNRSRIKLFIKTLRDFIYNFKSSKDLRISNLHYLFFINANFKFINIIKSFLKTNKIKFITNSYLDYPRGSQFFAASNSLNIPYFNFDYSLGFPLTNYKYCRYDTAARRYGNVLIANSKYRMAQYYNSTKYLNNPPEIILSACPQIIYGTRNHKKSLDLDNHANDKRFKIGIIDSSLSVDICPSKKDLESLIDIFKIHKSKFLFLLSSKKDNLGKIFESFVPKKFIKTSLSQGDFNVLSNSELILSLSWQGHALKAATLYKKPLIFYSENGFAYESMIFSNNQIENKKLISNLKKVWFSKKTLPHLISKLREPNYFESIKEASFNIIEIVKCINESKLSNNFEKLLDNFQ